MWAPRGPQSNRRLDGRAHPNDVADIRVPVLLELRGLDAGRERARGEPTAQGKVILCGGGHDCVLDGPIRDEFRVWDAGELGSDVHQRRGDHAADVGGAADPRPVRAWQLPADSGMWGPQRQRTSVHRG